MKFRVVLVLSIIFSSGALAEPPYRLEPGRDWLLVGSGCALTFGGLIAYNNVKALSLDEIAALDRTDINSFDRDAVTRFHQGTASDIATGLSVALPACLMTDSRIREDWKTIGAMWCETFLLQAGLNAIVKSLTERVRPYAYAEDTPLARKTDSEARVSFYSGHTGTAAAMSFLSARIYSDYHPHSRSRYFVWSMAIVLPAAIGVHRVESGQHFPSDVIAGYLTGAAIGYFIPALHSVTASGRVQMGPTVLDGASGVRLSLRF